MRIGHGILMLAVLVTAVPSFAGPRFTDNGDGTVTDHQLGLMWAKSDNQGDIAWHQAQAWAKYNFGIGLKSQYDNWRLPTLDELQTLFVSNPKYQGYRTDCGVLAKIASQIQISCILIWASDTALGSHMVFNFNIGSGFTVPEYDIKGCRALAVRTIQ